MKRIVLVATTLLLTVNGIRIDDQITISGLGTAAEKYNDKQANIISIKRGEKNLREFRYGVKLVSGKKELALKRENIQGGTKRARGEPEQKSMKDIIDQVKFSEGRFELPPNFETQNLSQDEKQELKEFYAKLLHTMDKDQWLDYGDNEAFTKSIGREIDLNFGYVGMQFVANACCTNLQRQYLDRSWDGVGQWRG